MRFEERYKLQVPIAESDRGTMWSGHDAKLARKVVIAVMETDAPEAARTRFAEQTAKMVALRHANLVRVLDVGRTEEDAPYASMEVVEGDTLEKRLVEGPAMRVDQAVRMVADLCGALAVLHRAGLAHGDVHPGNILVKELGGRVTPKLLGLGLNRAGERQGVDAVDEADLTTLAYMAPAQARGEILADPASDVYSAAAIVFSLVTGRLPHRGRDASALRDAVKERAVPAVGDVRAELAGPIAEVLDEALAPDPAKRFETADALAKALRTALIRTRTPGAFQTVVGARSIEDDGSDSELALKRISKPTAAPPKPQLGSLPKPSGRGATGLGQLPPKAPASAATRPSTPKSIEGAKPAVEATEPKRPTGPAPSAAKPAAAKPVAAKSAAAQPTAATPIAANPTAVKPSAEDSQEFERLSGLLEHPDWERTPPPPPAAAEAAPAEPRTAEDPNESAEFERLSGLLEIPQVDPKTASTPPLPSEPKVAAPPSSEPKTAATTSSDVEPVATAASPEPKLAPAPETALRDAATAAAAPAPSPGPDEGLETFPAEAIAGAGGVPTWVWAVVGVAAAAALVVTAVAMMGEETLEETAHAQNEARAEVAEAPSVLPEPAQAEEVDEAEPQDELPEPVAPIEEPALEPVTLTLTGVPEGATITLDGEPVSGTELELTPSEAERALAVQLTGHEEFRQSVPGDRSVEVAVQLRATPAVEPPRPRARPSRARAERPRATRPRNTKSADRRPATTRPAKRARPAARRSGRPAAIRDPGF